MRIEEVNLVVQYKDIIGVYIEKWLSILATISISK